MLLVFVLFGIFLIVYFYDWNERNKHLPPGPWGIPIFGVLPFANFKDQCAALTKIKQKYGPLVSMKMGQKLVLYLLDYETVHEAFEKQPETFAGRFDFLPLNVGRNRLGITMQQGKKWQLIRRFIHSTLRDFGMGKKSMESKIHDEVRAFGKQVIEKSEGKAFMPNFSLVTSNIIANIIFGHRFEYDDPEYVEFQRICDSAFRLRDSVILASFLPWLKYFPRYKRDENELVSDLKVMWKSIDKMIKQTEINLDKEPINFLGTLLQEARSSDEKHAIYYERTPDGSVNTITQIITQLFNGGTETTATTLEWAFAALIKYPELQRKMQAEIDREIGTELPSYEHLPNLALCNAFCMEAQRFGNIASISIPHETTEDTYLRGYFIPKETVVNAGLCTIMNDVNYFKDADEFNPYRFIKEDGSVNQRPTAFMPFSAGKRMCPGDTLAKRELFLSVTGLLHKYNFRAPNGEIPTLKPLYQLTTHPEQYRMVATSRTYTLGKTT